MEKVSVDVERLTALAKKRGVTNTFLCESVNRTKWYLRDVANGKGRVTPTMVGIWADILNTTPAYLCGDTDNPEKPTEEQEVLVPVYGTISCGDPKLAVENIIDYVEITRKQVSTGVHFGLLAKGDSMSPRIANGDTVIIKQQSDVEDGQIAAVLVDGQDATLKKVVHIDKGLMLIPINSNFEPVVYPKDKVIILGRAIETRAKL